MTSAFARDNKERYKLFAAGNTKNLTSLHESQEICEAQIWSLEEEIRSLDSRANELRLSLQRLEQPSSEAGVILDLIQQVIEQRAVYVQDLRGLREQFEALENSCFNICDGVAKSLAIAAHFDALMKQSLSRLGELNVSIDLAINLTGHLMIGIVGSIRQLAAVLTKRTS